MKMAKLALPVLVILFSAFSLLGHPAMADQSLHVTPATLVNLQKLKPEFNFGPDPKTMYTGDPNPVEREAGRAAFSHLIDTLVRDLPAHPTKNFVLQQFELALSPLSLADTEDRERAGMYCEKVMDVLGIESSDGFLNRWLYGPVLGDLVKKKP